MLKSFLQVSFHEFQGSLNYLAGAVVIILVVETVNARRVVHDFQSNIPAKRFSHKPIERLQVRYLVAEAGVQSIFCSIC